MENKVILAIAAVAIVAVGGIGFANTLTISGTANPLGGDDTNVVASPNADVTDISYDLGATATGGINVTGVDLTIDNTDGGSAHTFEACAVLSGPPVSDLGCDTTGSILASGTGSANVTFSNQGISAEDLDNVAISVEETS